MATQGLVAVVSSTQRDAFEAPPDIAQLKAAFSRLPAGVVVVTSGSPCGELVGATVSSFTSLSFAPPLVLLGLANESKTLSVILGHVHFAVHVVAEPQRHLAMRFASSGAHKFEAIAYDLSSCGVPILTDFETRLLCRLERAQTAGDHHLLIGRVIDVALGQREVQPVAWFQKAFRCFQGFPAV